MENALRPVKIHCSIAEQWRRKIPSHCAPSHHNFTTQCFIRVTDFSVGRGCWEKKSIFYIGYSVINEQVS